MRRVVRFVTPVAGRVPGGFLRGLLGDLRCRLLHRCAWLPTFLDQGIPAYRCSVCGRWRFPGGR